jgi:hypothetical protein
MLLANFSCRGKLRPLGLVQMQYQSTKCCGSRFDTGLSRARKARLIHV